MRPHRIALTAFGPFAGTVEVDLDALAESGLFLLHGETGAGKTTLLDGVGFALFGRVPGARGGMPLRSQHAADDVATQVQLEVTLAGRRLRITRSPSYDRAKSRGTGTTTVQAKVLLEELVDGSWLPLSTRIDEAARELDPLLGMSAEQFFQVVLLPQGEFARFLRASSADRGEVLERLFGTARFGAVEDWLASRRATLAAQVGAARQVAELLLERVRTGAERTGPDLPGPEELATAGAWAAAVLDTARQGAQADADAVAQLEVERDARRAELLEQQRLAELQARRSDLDRRAAELAERDDQVELLRAELDAAQRASAVEQPAADRDRARARRETAEQAVEVAWNALPEDLALLELDPLRVARDADQQQRGAADQLRAVAHEHVDASRRAASARKAAQTAGTAGDQAREALAALPQRRAALEAQVAAAEAAEGSLPEAQQRVQRAAEALEQVGALARVVGQVATLEDERRTGRDRALDLKEALLDVRLRRFEGMAAELARDLEDGVDCPVCGSQEHPDPSLMSPDHVGREQEDAAQVAHDSAARALAGLEVRLAVAAAERERLEELVGPTTRETAAAEAGEARAELAALETVSRPLPGLRRQLADLVQQEHALELALADTAAQLASSSAEAERETAAAQRTLDVLTDAAFDGQGDPVAWAEQLREQTASRIALADGALAAAAALDRALEQARSADQALAVAVTASGCADEAETREHLRPAAWVQRITEQLRRHDVERATVAEQLTDPALDVPLDPPADPRPEPALLAEDRLARARARHGATSATAAELARAVPALQEALTELAPLEQRATEVRQLADLCAGGGANTYKMTLSSFVLAARLEEVAEVASQRLLRMTQGRYQLVHSDDQARGGKRSGLGLKARDAWTGQDRDTATLSGGETFLASLALALALAEVVAQEAGAGRLDALFVDEGFGTLDEETLDEVMDVLDGLREGGRLVGVVSHVAELKQRIPAQVHVRKGRTGSAVEVTTG